MNKDNRGLWLLQYGTFLLYIRLFVCPSSMFFIAGFWAVEWHGWSLRRGLRSLPSLPTLEGVQRWRRQSVDPRAVIRAYYLAARMNTGHNLVQCGSISADLVIRGKGRRRVDPDLAQLERSCRPSITSRGGQWLQAVASRSRNACA